MSSLNRTHKRDKVGCEFEVGICGPESSPDIKKMYDGFLMLAISQGLPPAEKQTRDRWIENLLEFGRNVLTWVEGIAVGHAAIIPDFDRGHGEYVIFVSEPFRNRGLGTALTQLAVEDSRFIRLNRLWLTVEPYNFIALRLYRNAGFKDVDQGEREITMILRP